MALLRRKPSFARDRAPGRFRARMARARAISTARLNASRRLQLRPIDLVVYEGPYPKGELISETASRLDAFSGYPFRAWLAGRAVGRQPGHQRPVRPGPLVLGVDLLSSPAPTEDRDRTVSRRSEPSSRTALNGEQPYPWDLLQPQDAMSRHRGAKPCRRCGLLGKISLLSPEYLLSVERRPFRSGRRITRADFRPCSACGPRSQAGLHSCAPRTVADRPEPTLRAPPLLFGRRPPQSNYPPGTVPRPASRVGVRPPTRRGQYSKVASTGACAPASRAPAYPLRDAPSANAKLQ